MRALVAERVSLVELVACRFSLVRRSAAAVRAESVPAAAAAAAAAAVPPPCLSMQELLQLPPPPNPHLLLLLLVFRCPQCLSRSFIFLGLSGALASCLMPYAIYLMPYVNLFFF